MRRMRSLTVAVALTLTAAGAASASPGAIAVPPMSIDVGAGTPVGLEATATTVASTELRIGASWASLYWKPTRFDVSIGYVGSYRTLLADGAVARTTSLPAANELRLHGVYTEVSYAIENHRHWRTWLGGRIETLTGEYRERSLGAVGAAVRIGSELYSTGAHAGGGGSVVAMAAVAFAIGVYVEGTARTLPRELGPVGVGAGVSVRIPFIAAIGG
jgi:hypothetical protein